MSCANGLTRNDKDNKMTSIHKPLLIVIAGPNGSGKTTITSQLLHHEWLEDAVYINPDIIARDKFGDWNSPEAVISAARYCEKLREQCLIERKSLIFETVLSAPDKVDFINRAIESGYFVRLFFVSTENPQINASRIAKRVMEGGHDVPIPKIISRYSKSIYNCFQLASIVDRLYVYDNSRDGKDARILFRAVKGTIVKQYTDNMPEWAKNIL